MKRMFGVIMLCAVASIVIYSCTHVSGTYVSTNGSMAGRSMQGNCMDCHKRGATEGGFTIGGSLYQSDSVTRYPNGFVDIYSQLDTLGKAVDSSLIAHIEVDGVGNFYTTHDIDLSQGFYPVVTSSEGYKKTMSTVTTNGACNSCHGVSTSNIYVF